ncbi:MAG: fumarate reductase (quinol) flavoprotein subunit [Lysobacterales bacterium]
MMMRTIRADVVIIGAGGAGLRAAIAVAENDPSLRVALLSKVYPMRSHTVAAEGGAAGVTQSPDTLDAHFKDTVSGGDWLCDQDAVERFVEQAPKSLRQLEHWGCPWNRDDQGGVQVRSFGGMKHQRTWFAADKSGFHILHTLFQTSQQFPSIQRFDEVFALDLLTDGGVVGGVTALDIQSGEPMVFLGASVIVASGGAGRVFPFTTNGAIKTGDGMAMAYRAGVPLKDIEFVQYHPTGLPGTGILITEGARGEGGLLYNRDGYRYLQDYNLGPPDPWPRLKAMELGPRDRLSQAFWHEQRRGRTIKGEFGDVVHLDIRHLGEQKINERLPMVRELARAYVGVDPVHAPIPVRPVVHYTMGGIDTDIDTGTALTGLFAAGECACVSINGANRLGSNSLTEILVFGEIAGLQAAAVARGGNRIAEHCFSDQIAASFERSQAPIKRPPSAESIVGLRRELHDLMEGAAGIYREDAPLQAACGKVAELRRRYQQLAIGDHSRVFNTQLFQALELGAMLDIGEAMVHAALHRRESRGAHQRLDFPERNDAEFLHHSLLSYRGDQPPGFSTKPVTITRFQPAERVYGGAAP